MAILCDNSYIYLYDCAKDEIRQVISPGLYQVTNFMWNADGSDLLLTCSDDTARIVSVKNGEVLQVLACPFALKRASYGQEDNNGNSTNDTFVLLEGDGELCVFLLTAKGENAPLMTRLNDKLSVMSTISDNTYRIRIAKDGTKIWNYHGDGLHVYDAESGEVLQVIKGEDTSSTLLPLEQYMISYRSRDGSVIAEDTIRVYDPDTYELLKSLTLSYPHVSIYVPPSGDARSTDMGDDMVLSNVFLNEDASMLFAAGNSVSKFPCLFAFRTDTWEECWSIGYDWGLPTDRLFDFAADWEGFIELDSYLLPESGKILCIYTYDTDPKKDFDTMRENALSNYSHQIAGSGFEESCSVHIAAEVRDAQTGEVLQVYGLPYTVLMFYEEPEAGLLLAQGADYNVHILKAETAEELALCEADSRIFDYAVTDSDIQLRYELFGTMESTAPQGHIVSLSGEVTRIQASEIDMPVLHDGYYGGTPFTATADGLYDVQTGVALVHWDEGQYHYLTSWEDGRGVLLFAPFKAASTMQVDGDVVILRWADGTALRSIARQLLGERELSETQKETYFLK